MVVVVVILEEACDFDSVRVVAPLLCSRAMTQDNQFMLLIEVVTVTMTISTFVSHTVAALILMPLIVKVSLKRNTDVHETPQENQLLGGRFQGQVRQGKRGRGEVVRWGVIGSSSGLTYRLVE